MRRFFGAIGTVTRVTVESQALKNNMLGDPASISLRCKRFRVSAGVIRLPIVPNAPITGSTIRSTAGLASSCSRWSGMVTSPTWVCRS